MKLRPVFEYLRQLKLKNKQEFSQNLETLTGTLETRSGSAKQALKKDCLTLSNVIMIGTRKNSLNTKIEPHVEGSKKLNVDKLPTLELYKSIISTMQEDMQVYYNMRIALGLECA